MSDPRIRIVVFDIDGTLLDTGGVGRRSYLRALEEALGGPLPAEKHEFAGHTDLGILHYFLEKVGRGDADAATRQRILDGYVHYLDQELARGPEGGLCPGVGELLPALESDPRYRVGLLTGNLAAAARVKLTHYGILGAFRFGAFGDDDPDRDRLVPIARQRAEEAEGRALPDAPILVIGDTPRDVACARAGRAAVLAVATGLYSEAELAATRPDVLLRDLSDTGAVMAAIERLTGPTPPPTGSATPHRGD